MQYTTGRTTQIRREVSGEEAIAIGAYRAGVRFVTGYPGKPSARTLQLLSSVAKERKIRVEWAVNGKVALEEALGASLLNKRALVCMPGASLNIAFDSLIAAATTGSKAGLVLLVGDDPGAWHAIFEQDSRQLAKIAEIPIFEPSTPAEGAEMIQEAFRLSEEYQVPVMVRIVLAYSEMKGEISAEKVQRPEERDARFSREDGRWVAKPEKAAERHQRLRWKLERVAESFEHSVFNTFEGNAQKAVVSVGHVASEVEDIVGEIAKNHFTLLKLGTPFPLPEGLILSCFETVEEVVVLEEHEPVVETALLELVNRRVLSIDVKGRLTGLVPKTGELFRWQIDEILSQYEPRFDAAKTYFPYQESGARERPKSFCTGCPFAGAFRVLRKVINTVYSDAPPILIGDPGCTIRADDAPFNLFDVSYNLSSALNIAVGMSEMGPAVPVIAITGDGAFFGDGISGLINAVRNNAQLVLVIFDNDTAATTGFQPTAGSTYGLKDERPKRIVLEELIHSCGVDLLRVVDPENDVRTRQVFSEALAIDGIRVIILRAPCPLIH